MDVIESIELVVKEVNERKILRRKIRNIIFRLRVKPNRLFNQFEKDRAPGVRMIFEPQFRKSPDGILMTWENFTYVWDLNPITPLKTVFTSEWAHAGGEYTKEGFCKPTAFTHQKV